MNNKTNSFGLDIRDSDDYNLNGKEGVGDGERKFNRPSSEGGICIGGYSSNILNKLKFNKRKNNHDKSK
jgi:hypothetical protein